MVHDELRAHYGVRKLGPCDGVQEHFFAIGTEKKVQHPLVQQVLDANTL
jgi:LysR family transcriptional activator of nhaA